MNIKVVKRSLVIKNLILFILFSIFYLHLLYSLNRGVSAFDIAGLKMNIQNEWALVMLGLTSIVSIFLGLKASRFIYFLFFSIVIVKGSIPLFKELDKFLLIMNFIYLVFSYYFHLFWKLELSEAFYKPCFTKRDLGPKSALPFSVKVTDKNGIEVKGDLTNWDKNGCFIALKGAQSIRGKINVEIQYEERSFSQEGVVMTEYDNGVGIKFQKKASVAVHHSWADFYDILRDRGFIFQ